MKISVTDCSNRKRTTFNLYLADKRASNSSKRASNVSHRALRALFSAIRPLIAAREIPSKSTLKGPLTYLYVLPTPLPFLRDPL
jgi:hypothetical protein